MTANPLPPPLTPRQISNLVRCFYIKRRRLGAYVDDLGGKPWGIDNTEGVKNKKLKSRVSSEVHGVALLGKNRTLATVRSGPFSLAMISVT